METQNQNFSKLFVKGYFSSNVPFGWKREIINGSVVYTTPSNYLLWSPQEISLYLQSDGTCKCGIDCPLILENVFNFDPTVQTVAYFPNKSNEAESKKLCNHCTNINHHSTFVSPSSSSFPHQNLQSLSIFRNSPHSFLNSSLFNYSATNEINSTTDADQSLRNVQTLHNNVLNWLPLNHQHLVNDDQRKNLVPSQIQLPTSSSSLHQINTAEVTPALGLTSSIINHDSNNGPAPVLQLINPVQLTPMSSNAVTVLQSTQNNDGTTILFPQIVQSDSSQVILNSTPNVSSLNNPTVLSHLRTGTAFSAIPIQSSYTFQPTSYCSTSVTQLTKSKSSKIRRKKDNRSNRQPLTVAAILREVEEIGKRKKLEEEKKKQLEVLELNSIDVKEKKKIKELNDVNNVKEVKEVEESNEDNFYSSNFPEKVNHLNLIREVAVQSDSTHDIGNPVKKFEPQSSETVNNCLNNSDLIKADKASPIICDSLEIGFSKKDIETDNNQPSQNNCFKKDENDSKNKSIDISLKKQSKTTVPSVVKVQNNLHEKNMKRLERLKKELLCYENSFDNVSPESPPLSPQLRQFEIGDLVWGQMRGNPSWPGKLITENDVPGNPVKSDKGKVWVKWFGDNTYTQVETEKLKTLSEGLEAHHTARKKHRKGKKTNTSLEYAIQEAMLELDKQVESI